LRICLGGSNKTVPKRSEFSANAKSQLLEFDFWLDGRWFDFRKEMIPGAASFSVKAANGLRKPGTAEIAAPVWN
jgi:hypothetical protein